MPAALTATGRRVESRRDLANGAVYTPPLLATWVASRLLRHLPMDEPSVIDFACGDGALLRALATESTSPPRLVGSDIDPVAIRQAAGLLPTARLEQLDAIETSLSGVNRLRDALGVEHVDGIVLNPPWGIELEAERSDLRAAGFELARGQFDSSDLFLELALKLLDEGSVAALILPDSLFFPDRAPLRRLLLKTCTIELIARLGEGFFPGVYRGTAVLVLRRGAAPPRHTVECLRLSPHQRKRVLAGDATLEEIAAANGHSVPQSRFARSGDAGFSIDLRQADLKHVKAVCQRTADWTRTLEGGRGVELSKHGEVIICPDCERSRPRPRRSVTIGCECGAAIDPERARRKKIVREIRQDGAQAGWQPLVAGEDVRRYHCRPGREIQVGIEGINYKDEADLRGPRLLVRKTGIGLKAAILSTRAFTTQTVFHFQLTSDSPDFLLRYALGVISSRIMLAVHLKRTGENEWRSHPYVTQSLLAELPIPHPEPDSRQWRQARAIADLARNRGGYPPSVERDLQIEGLVAGLYGLDTADLSWVAQVLREAQGLEGINSLRLPADTRLEPLLVD